MLAEEYILIVPFAYHLSFGLKEHRMSAQQKALSLSSKQLMTEGSFGKKQ
jgi:hypothetical protein